jgi:hypothetical protein
MTRLLLYANFYVSVVLLLLVAFSHPSSAAMNAAPLELLPISDDEQKAFIKGE